MRVTKEIRKYIRNQIIARAQAEIDSIESSLEAEENDMKSRVDSVDAYVKECLEKMRKDVVAYAKSRGLTARESMRISACVSFDDFFETHTEYYNDGARYHNNKKYCKLWKARRSLDEKINNFVAEIVFKLEAGAKLGEIEAMLAAVKF